MKARAKGAVAVGAVALAARLAVVAWASGKFPPTGDGTFYSSIGARIASGLGYTVAWPDGAVTYAAHYPIGYPAIVGALYALFGVKPVVVMVFNACLGALGAVAIFGAALRATSLRWALVAGLAVALHPGLVFYTPALMTEGVTASLMAIAVYVAARARDDERFVRAAIAIGLLLGAATLIRPQAIVLAPIFAALAPAARFFESPRAKLRTLSAAIVAFAAALAVCAPWTLRNCARMHRCALVSVNGGWNLLIGTDTTNGTWNEIIVPDECKEEFDEAQKDVCFGDVARRRIVDRPRDWIARMPTKLGATFDYSGAPGWYLHQSNEGAFPRSDKLALGGVETLFERVAVALSLLFLARAPGPRRFARVAVAALAGATLFTTHAWPAWIAIPVVSLLLGRAVVKAPLLVTSAAFAVLATAATHAVFFGAGRYSVVLFPLVTGVGAMSFRRDFDTTARVS